jgi:hypothetical protein
MLQQKRQVMNTLGIGWLQYAALMMMYARQLLGRLLPLVRSRNLPILMWHRLRHGALIELDFLWRRRPSDLIRLEVTILVRIVALQVLVVLKGQLFHSSRFLVQASAAATPSQVRTVDPAPTALATLPRTSGCKSVLH